MGTPRKQSAIPRSAADLVGTDVEVRTSAHGLHRGQLLAAGDAWLTLSIASNGCPALIPMAAVSAVYVSQRFRFEDEEDDERA